MNTTIILSICFIAICFAGICVKILLKKDGQFSGTCASNNPFLNKAGEKCNYCGADPGEECKNSEKPLEK
ncbi:MAG: membrane or secreted protein [Flavobacteriales bacterium]|nr:membrane or secreted protein [Flavobacteriales bacterium]